MSQRPRATLEEVSLKAGCSPATVSRVLNNSGPVSHSVRRNVLRVVRESGYVPRGVRRPSARGEVGAGDGADGQGPIEVLLHRCSPMERLSSDASGFHIEPSQKVNGPAILSDSYRLSADFYMHIINGVMAELEAAGRRALLQITDNLESPKVTAEINRANNAGVLLLGEYPADPEVLQRFVEQCRCPLVLIDIIHPARPDTVTIDNVAGIAAAVDHLLSLGHRDIGYVGKPYNTSFQERWTSFRWKMVDAQLPVRPEWVYHGPDQIEATATGVADILRREAYPTAFVCANDFSAMGVLRAAERCGIGVPAGLSVVGFDDVGAAALVTPPLTTVRVPLRDLGRQAVRQLLIAERFDPIERARGCVVRVAPELVVRGSTGPVPR